MLLPMVRYLHLSYRTFKVGVRDIKSLIDFFNALANVVLPEKGVPQKI